MGGPASGRSLRSLQEFGRSAHSATAMGLARFVGTALRGGAGFLHELVARDLTGVQLAISDAHPGLKAAIARVLGCPWQRCTAHFLRDRLGHCRRDEHGMLATLIRPIFNQPDLASARDRLSEAVAALEGKLDKVAVMLEGAEEDILAFYGFPAELRTDVVGNFPDNASLLRFASMLAIEQNDEWLVGRRYLSVGSIALVLEDQGDRPTDLEEVRQLQAA